MFADKELQDFNIKITEISKINLTPEDLKAFGQELDQIKKEIEAKLGKEDIDYIIFAHQLSRYTELLGRLLLHFSLDIVSWSSGVFLLYLSKVCLCSANLPSPYSARPTIAMWRRR